MNQAAKSMILKGNDNLETAKRCIDDENQHDIAGYNLAQAVEHFLKSLIMIRDLEFPESDEAHDLDALMTVLEEANFSAISSYADVVELTVYNSLNARVHQSQRLNLYEALQQVEDLKTFIGKIAL